MAELSKARTRLVARLHRRRQREREGRVLVEGPRAVREVQRVLARSGPEGGATPVWYAASPRLREVDPDLAHALGSGTHDVTWLDDRQLDDLADTAHPQGVLMVAPEPRHVLADVVRPTARLLVLDGLQDPGNVGTLIRTAAAFALDGVLALDGSVDPWNPKAVRASAGTSFALPVLTAPWSAVRPALGAAGLPLLLADAGGIDVGGVDVDGIPVSGAGRDVGGPGAARGWVLVLGSEGSGARPEVVSAASARVAIPMPGGTESLNVGVAGSLLVHALTRKAPPPGP